MGQVNLAELGAFLKSRRDRIRPGNVGLPEGSRRRVTGLRREEVAELAGLSVDYYIEIERGDAQPSEQLLAALSRALRLSTDERSHVARLAGRATPTAMAPTTTAPTTTAPTNPQPTNPHPTGTAATPTPSTEPIDPALRDLFDHLADVPARIITDLHVTLAQNAVADRVLGPSPAVRGWASSCVYRWFTDPRAREVFPEDDHDHHSRAYVADLRAAVARHDHRDHWISRMIMDLEHRSHEFAELWARRDVAVRRVERKRVVHPEQGVLELNSFSQFSEDGRQRLLWFTPVPGTEHRTRSAGW